MNNAIRHVIFGREFDLPFSYQNFPGEEVTENQIKTLDSVGLVNYEDALEGVKQYILKYYASEINAPIDNIFKYVMPKRIAIIREKEKRVFAIMCDFKFDMEHGLAIVFEDEVFKEVGAQDIIL